MIAARAFLGVTRAISFKAALPFSRKTTIAGRRSLQLFSPSGLHLVPEAQTEAQLSLRCRKSLLEAEVNSRKQGCGKRALEILRAWETSDSLSPPSNIHDEHTTQGPDLLSFALVVRALLLDPSIPRGEKVAQAEKIYEKAKLKHSTTQFDSSESPSFLSKEQWGELQFALLSAYVTSTSNDVSCAGRADALVTEMLDYTETANTLACNQVLKAWRTVARRPRECPEAIPRARALLVRMEERNLTDCVSYDTFIGALISTPKNEKSVREAIDLLDKIDRLYAETGKVAYKANVGVVNSVISAWVWLKQPQRAQELLVRLEGEGSTMNALYSSTYNEIMYSWANSGRKDAAERTEEVFQRMQQMYQQGNAQVRPNSKSYIILIRAFTQSGNAQFVQKAEDVLFQNYKNYQQGDGSLKPDTEAVNHVMRAWVGCRQPQRAHQLLDRIEEEYWLAMSSGSAVMAPDVLTYSIVMGGWAKWHSKEDAALNTEAVFDRLLHMYQQGNAEARPDITCYATYIQACARSCDAQFAQKAEDVFFGLCRVHQQGDHSLKPDTQTMNLVFLAWTRCGQPQRAQQLLDRIEEEYQRESLTMSSGSAVMVPNTITYNVVMESWAKSGGIDAAKNTEAVFDRMLQMYKQGIAQARPNIESYATYTDVCAKSCDAQFAQKAEDVLFGLFNAYQQGDRSLLPDKQTMNSVILSWARCGQPLRAQQVLDRIEEEYQRQSHTMSSGSAVVAPNTLSYNIVMGCWAKWDEKDAAINAEAVFDRMLQMYKQGNAHARPDRVSYLTYIGVCANANDAHFTQKAEDALFRMYDEKLSKDPKSKEKTVRIVMLAWERCGHPQRAQQLYERIMRHEEKIDYKY